MTMRMLTKTYSTAGVAAAACSAATMANNTKAWAVYRRWSTVRTAVSPVRMVLFSSISTTRNFSTNLNEDNTAQYHEHMHHHRDPSSSSQQQHQEWTTFNGKIPVLKTDVSPQASPSTTAMSSSTSTTMTTKSTTTLSPSAEPFGYERPRVSLLMELTDRVGVLHDVLKFFWKYDLSISRIESRPVHSSKNQWGQNEPVFDFALDFYGSLDDPVVQKLMSDLDPITEKLLVLDEKDVQWFPRHISELDLIAHRTLDAGVDLESDHPGFNDETYRARRAELAENAINHRWDQPIPRIEYTNNEIETWSAVWDKMEALWEDYACKEYLHSLELFKMYCGYSRDNIPQQQDISAFLKQRTNFEMRPVAGLLSSRDFLNGLAFRVFFSTQYIRHHSQPLYTPEPDICHELLGHAYV